jgi:hypothetical protein
MTMRRPNWGPEIARAQQDLRRSSAAIDGGLTGRDQRSAPRGAGNQAIITTRGRNPGLHVRGRPDEDDPIDHR